jgi:hypothetical protein
MTTWKEPQGLQGRQWALPDNSGAVEEMTMFTERDALVHMARQEDLLREAEQERRARAATPAKRPGQHSLAFRFGHALEALGQRLQRVAGHETQGQGSPAQKAAYER